MPCFEPVLMMSPTRCRAIMPGANTWAPLIMPQRLTPSTRSQFSRGPNIALPGCTPALFIKTSVPPKRSRTVASSRVTSSTRLTSVAMVMTCRTPARYRGHGQRGCPQPILAEIGDAHAQAQARERFGRGKTDAGRAAGDDSHGTGRQSRMGQRQTPLLRRGRMKRWLRHDPETVRKQERISQCSQATTATFLKARTGLFEPKSPLRGNGIFRAETKGPKRL